MIKFYWKSKHATLIDEEVFVIFFIPLGVLWLGDRQTCSRIAERCCPSSQWAAAHAGAAARGFRVLPWCHSCVQYSPVSRQTGASLVSAPAQRRSSPRTGRKPVEASYARWICDAILPFRPSISALTVPGTRSMEGGQRTVSTCPANTLDNCVLDDSLGRLVRPSWCFRKTPGSVSQAGTEASETMCRSFAGDHSH